MRSRRVLVTRPVDQADDLAGLLVERGLEPVVVPTVAVDVTTTRAALAEMLHGLDGADWLVLTSANGARALSASLDGERLPASVRVAAVGPATASALREAGIGVDHVPDVHLTVAIAEGLGDVNGRRVVLARADAATPDLRDALVERGARVEEVVAYRTLEGPAASADGIRSALRRPLGGVAFTSGSTVRGLVELTPAADRGRLRSIPAFCIGPVTADVAHRHGFDVAVVAEPHTAPGLADAIAHDYAREDR